VTWTAAAHLDYGGKVLRDAAFPPISKQKRRRGVPCRRSPSHIQATLIQGALFDTLEAAI